MIKKFNNNSRQFVGSETTEPFLVQNWLGTFSDWKFSVLQRNCTENHSKIDHNVEGQGSARWQARTNLSLIMYCVHIWLPRPTNWAPFGVPTWVEPYKSDSGQFCLSYNHIKYELKFFFQPIFDHNYLYLYG